MSVRLEFSVQKPESTHRSQLVELKGFDKFFVLHDECEFLDLLMEFLAERLLLLRDLNERLEIGRGAIMQRKRRLYGDIVRCFCWWWSTYLDRSR